MSSMNADARRALATIRRCVEDERYVVLPHFTQRMDQRGLFWPDVLAVLDEPTGVRGDGRDKDDRAKWIVGGKTPDGLAIEIVCALDVDENGDVTVFITIY